MSLRRYFVFFATCAALSLLINCGGSSSSSTTTTTTQISNITVSPTSAAIVVGQDQAFTATVKNSDGTILSGGTLAWTSSNTGVATITPTGVATGAAPGNTQITAAAEGVTSSAVTLTVTNKVVTVTISPLSTTVAKGATVQFTAVAKDASGNVIQGAQFQWACNASSIATIDQTGLATGVSPGTVAITASSGGISSQVAMLTVQ